MYENSGLGVRKRRNQQPRAFCHRNVERTNRLLELVRLRLNLVDDQDHYAQAIRAHLAATGGKLAEQGDIRDPRDEPSLRR